MGEARFARLDLSLKVSHDLVQSSQERVVTRFGVEIGPRHFQQRFDPERGPEFMAFFERYARGSDLREVLQPLQLGLDELSPKRASVEAAIEEQDPHRASRIVAVRSRVLRLRSHIIGFHLCLVLSRLKVSGWAQPLPWPGIPGSTQVRGSPSR